MTTQNSSIYRSVLSSITMMVLLQSNLANAFAIAAKGSILSMSQPVHETMTQKAALDSGFLSANQTEEMKHLIEGVRFNDDPEGYLAKGAIIRFGLKFTGSDKELQVNDPTKASHFGAYQFLHAMATGNATAEDVKEKIVLFASHCWKMATDPNSFANFKKDYDIVKKQQQSPKKNFKPTSEQIIVSNAIKHFPEEILFFQSTNQKEFQFRAIGSLLHVIQDSYAKGHVVRKGWEQGDNSGKVVYFQNYSEQDSGKHGDHDLHESGDVHEHNVLDIAGSAAAYEKSKQLLSLIAKKCPWTSAGLKANPRCNQSVYGFLTKDVFAFDENTPIPSRSTRSHPEMYPMPTDQTDYQHAVSND